MPSRVCSDARWLMPDNSEMLYLKLGSALALDFDQRLMNSQVGIKV